MAYEDFTTYTEVDEHGDITVTAPKVQWVNMDNDSTSYVYKDYGIDNFENFSHDTEFYAVFAHQYGKSGFWVVGNNIADYDEYYDNSYQGIIVYFVKPGASYQFYLRDFNSANTDGGNVSQNTLYYCTITRVGTTATCYIYTDSGRTILHDTLTVTCTATAFRYVYSCMGNDEAQTGYVTSGYSQNFDLKLATGAAIYFYDGTNNIELQRDNESPVQMFNGTDIVGLKLGATDDAYASPFHVFDGTNIKAILKMP